jgi:hypothetical protein
VIALFPPEQREHGDETARLGHEGGNACPAGGSDLLFRRIAVGHDHIQVREPAYQGTHPPGHLTEPLAGVEDHNIGPTQFAQGEDAVGFCHPPHHSHIRPDGKTCGQGVTEQSPRRLHCHPYRDASMHRYHCCQGFRYLRSQQLLFGPGVYGYHATNAGKSRFRLLAALARSGADVPAVDGAGPDTSSGNASVLMRKLPAVARR